MLRSDCVFNASYGSFLSKGKSRCFVWKQDGSIKRRSKDRQPILDDLRHRAWWFKMSWMCNNKRKKSAYWLPRRRSWVSKSNQNNVTVECGQCVKCYDIGHVRPDKSGYFQHAGEVIVFRNRWRGLFLFKHPFAAGLSGHNHPAVHVHGAVFYK